LGIATLLVAGALTLGIWYVARHVYIRSGRGVRIGIIYRGIRVPLDDWVWTRRKFKSLLDDRQLTNAVSLRMLPPHLYDSPARRDDLQKKLGYTMIVIVTASPAKHSHNPPALKVHFHAKSKAALSRDFLEATDRHIQNIVSNRPPPPNDLASKLEYTATTLFELILLPLGVIAASDRRFNEATSLLRCLESRIADRFAHDQYPRRAVRYMISRCIVAPACFPTKELPQGDALLEVADQADQAATEFAGEFPDVYHIAARACFFANNLDLAINHATAGLEVAQSDKDKLYLSLDLAVLHLFKSHYAESRKYFSMVFDQFDYRSLNWLDLVDFADYSYDTCSDNALYIRALYRHISPNHSIPPTLASEVDAWLSADMSRSGLKALYRRMLEKKRDKPASSKRKHRRRKGRSR
jgi:hypothetical protein